MSYKSWYNGVIAHLKDVTHCSNGGYIYSNEEEMKNFIFEQELSQVFPAMTMKSLQKDWRHANSSQVMCLNFFAGLIGENNDKLTQFVNSVLGIDGFVTYFAAEYTEKGLKLRSSNFDFYIETDTGIRIYFEIKYTEPGFAAKARGKVDWWEAYYRPLCEQSYHLKNVERNEFMQMHFQLYRNLAMAKENSYCVFITDSNNPATSRELAPWINKKNIIILSWQDAVKKVLDLSISTDYFKRFEEKYLDY